MTANSFETAVASQIDEGAAFVRKIDLTWKEGGAEALLDKIDRHVWNARATAECPPVCDEVGHNSWFLQKKKGKWHNGILEYKYKWLDHVLQGAGAVSPNTDKRVAPASKWDLSSAKTKAREATKERTLSDLRTEHEI